MLRWIRNRGGRRPHRHRHDTEWTDAMTLERCHVVSRACVLRRAGGPRSMVYVGRTAHAERRPRSAQELLEYTHRIPADYGLTETGDEPWYPTLEQVRLAHSLGAGGW